jgi:hypothetical protein
VSLAPPIEPVVDLVAVLPLSFPTRAHRSARNESSRMLRRRTRKGLSVLSLSSPTAASCFD